MADTEWLAAQETRWPVEPARPIWTGAGDSTDADWPPQQEQGTLALEFGTDGTMRVRNAPPGTRPAGIAPVHLEPDDMFGMGKAQAAASKADAARPAQDIESCPF